MIGSSIVVYRNPLEQAAWEGLMNGNLFPIVAAVFACVAVVWFMHVVLTRFQPYTRSVPWKREQVWITNVSLLSGAAAFVGVLWWLAL